MSVYYSSPNTGDTISAQDANIVKKLWKKGVTIFEQTEDIFAKYQGGPNAIIESEMDTSKGAGQTITYPVMSGFYDPPHQGEALFETSADFQSLQVGDNQLAVDFFRHGFRMTQRTEEFLGMRGELNSQKNTEMGKWMGRLKSEQLFMMALHKTNPENTFIIGGTSIEDLTDDDTLSYEGIVDGKALMKPLGGAPAYMGRDSSGNPIWSTLVIGTDVALNDLKRDPTYKANLQQGEVRGSDNPLFKGGFTRVDGQIIDEYVPIDHDGHGPVGSPLNPKAFLGTAIAPAATPLQITGGRTADGAADTKQWYFRDFPLFAYPFLPTDVLNVSSDPDFYVAIINPKNAATDPGKFGFYQITYASGAGNTGNQLQVYKRLGNGDSHAGSNIQWNTVGNVTWDGTKHTQTHGIGSLVVLTNSFGRAFGTTLFLGKQAARRGWGKYQNERTEESHEGGFVQDTYVTSVFGQSPRSNRIGIVPGIIMAVHAINYQGWNMPSVPGS